MKSTQIIHHKQNAFPKLKWQEDEWLGKMTFFKWRSVGLSVNPAENGEQEGPTKEQQAAYFHLVEHTSDVIASLTSRLKKYYKRMRPRYLAFLGSKAAKLMPEVNEADELLRLIDLLHIYIHVDSEKGASYVGFHFDCTWEREHGLGFIMLRNKVIEVEGADISFSWSSK